MSKDLLGRLRRVFMPLPFRALAEVVLVGLLGNALFDFFNHRISILIAVSFLFAGALIYYAFHSKIRLISILRHNKTSAVTSVAAMMIQSRLWSFAYAVFPISVILIASIIAGLFFPAFNISSPTLNVVMAAYVILSAGDLWLTSYRINRGLFGDNEGEARAILAFIRVNRDRFDSGDGSFRIFDAVSRFVEEPGLAGLPEGTGHV